MPYTKTSNRQETFSGQYSEFVTFDGGGFAGPSGSNGQLANMPDVKSGERRTGYRKVIKDGGDATTYYNRDTYRVDAKSQGFARLTKASNPDKPWWTRSTSVYGGFGYPLNAVPLSHLATDLSEVDGAALTLLYKKIRSESSHMNGLQFFGELREALHMIRRPAESIWKGLEKYNTLLSKRKKGIRPQIPLDKKIDIWKGIVSGTWLEVSFGWRPFINDTKDIAETIARFTLPDNQRTRVRSYKEDTLGSDITGFRDAFAGNSNGVIVDVDFRTETRAGVQYICGLRSNGSGPVNQLNRLRNLSGLTLENFVPTLWELTPYSFLVDYFTNVGDILNSAFTNTVGVTWKMKTQRLTTTRTIVQSPGFAVSPPWVVESFDGKPSATVIVKSSVTRIPIVGPLGIPDLSFSLPGSLTKYGNIVALLAGIGSNNRPPIR